MLGQFETLASAVKEEFRLTAAGIWVVPDEKGVDYVKSIAR